MKRNKVKKRLAQLFGSENYESKFGEVDFGKMHANFTKCFRNVTIDVEITLEISDRYL